MAVQYGGTGGYRVQLRGPYGGVSIRAVGVEIPADGWKGAVSPFSREIGVEGVTAGCKIDLQPGPEQLETMRSLGMGLAAENDGGTVTLYAYGSKPREAMTIQATIMEVQR